MSAELLDDVLIRYPFNSRLTAVADKPKLELATAVREGGAPHMFEGKLLSSHCAASMLLLLPKLASTRFHTPPNMLAQILAAADPVMTCSRDILRLESFSACASAYARMDIAEEACEGQFIGKGTTNVDFQQGLRDALAALAADGDLGLSVGKSEVKVSIAEAEFVEKKVQLPARWTRSFAEVSSYQANMELVHDVAKTTALRFLQNLPSSPSDKADYYLVLRGGELALTQTKQTGAVKVAGLSRLKLLKQLGAHINRLRIYCDKAMTASSWLVDAGPYTLELVISAAPYRGFSGEGQLLEDLARDNVDAYLPRVRSALHWQGQINAGDIATECDTTVSVINTCLNKLASAGLVGYDCASHAYFHRELPYKAKRMIKCNPRLRGAKTIIENEAIEIIDAGEDFAEASVAGSGVKHIVRWCKSGSTCTCVWYAKHQGERGPCKHILSLQMLLEKNSGN